ncbi:uncharacterized protein SPPG_01401 [Spizellomyces punctatus DAOM BR117]|uniref:Uncharacterized protein n=1 Tax=Spizellomyces punctatus (strain DAOM BR117) TaxID=645134 RepID=A0A0L0HSR6_SPIPD|nr:uncharacterized protein SPPG_01401 [Spizellomyces punctatus DAOM BR117]KND03950.1 hypothetical protein SPPG_01401 [Spizellomyces punctatus DAOM BR117]|eukprot:XP_016611989.1 hypothetical protein SPPG_01401 [Spizellomyces punctatus DAOM BR117]
MDSKQPATNPTSSQPSPSPTLIPSHPPPSPPSRRPPSRKSLATHSWHSLDAIEPTYVPLKGSPATSRENISQPAQTKPQRSLFSWRSVASMWRLEKTGSTENLIEQTQPPPLPQPKQDTPPKKRKSKKSAAQSEPDTLFSHLSRPLSDFEHSIVNIRIHGADRFKLDARVAAPLVRVHILDAQTGKYIPKSDPNRPVTTRHEPDHVSYILPAMTKPFSFPHHQTTVPAWEEDLVFNEGYLHLLSVENVMVMFEVLELVTGKAVIRGQSDGYRRIAWGFLKLVSAGKKANTEQKARLQLYQYPLFPHPSSPSDPIPLVYRCFQAKKRKKFESTLYVTVSGRHPLPPRHVTGRAILPTDVEVGKESLEQLLHMYHAKRQIGESVTSPLVSTPTQQKHPQWRRRQGQRCKLPNTILYRIDSGTKGAFTCSFSHSGQYLAIACMDESGYPIKVYRVLTAERVAVLTGHADLVYEVNWARDDSELVSASSDGSVRVWSFPPSAPSLILHHPSYVYTATFHPTYAHQHAFHSPSHPTATSPNSHTNRIATGCYDTLIRIYSLHHTRKSHLDPLPTQILRGHEKNVNSVVFDASGRLFSADGEGMIRVWSEETGEGGFVCVKKYGGFQGTPITTLKLHPHNRRILVHLSTHTLHTLDTRVYRILTTYTGAPTTTTHTTFIRPTYTPCGSYVLSGTEDSRVMVWETDTGKTVKVYEVGTTVVDVGFHPWEHMVCFVSFGERTPVGVWKWVEGEDQDPLSHPIVKPVTTRPPKHPTQTPLDEKLASRKKQVSALISLVRQSLHDLVPPSNPSPAPSTSPSDSSERPLNDTTDIGISQGSIIGAVHDETLVRRKERRRKGDEGSTLLGHAVEEDGVYSRRAGSKSSRSLSSLVNV